MLFLKNYTLNYTFSSKKFISFIQGTLTLCQLYILQSVLLKKYKNLHLVSWNLKQKWIKIMNTRFFLLAFELWNTYFLSDLCRIQQFFNSTHSIELILSYLKLNQDFFFFSFTVWTFFLFWGFGKGPFYWKFWTRTFLFHFILGRVIHTDGNSTKASVQGNFFQLLCYILVGSSTRNLSGQDIECLGCGCRAVGVGYWDCVCWCSSKFSIHWNYCNVITTIYATCCLSFLLLQE